MMIGGDAQLSVLWLIAMIVLLIIEAVVPGLISIWFALGALAALVAALFHAPFWLQVVWFLVVSILTLLLTRPFVKKYVNNRVTPTNAEGSRGDRSDRQSAGEGGCAPGRKDLDGTHGRRERRRGSRRDGTYPSD